MTLRVNNTPVTRQCPEEKPFLWRTQHGEYKRLCDMSTAHLFSTLRMVWNNTMPEEARVGRVKLYHFSAYYTEAYFMEMCCRSLEELRVRTDVPAWILRELEQMAAYIRSKRARRVGAGQRGMSEVEM